MDFLGYAALGGLERVTIVAGAIIIGYWGYRLYTADKKAGLVFMGLAVVVLVGALATSTSHLKSLGEGYQLASLPPAEEAAPAATPEAEPETEMAEAPPAPAAEPERPADVDPAVAPAAIPEVAEAPEAPAPAELPAAPEEAALEAKAASVRIATGQELGGRIVSVKSENVSLEWSSDN